MHHAVHVFRSFPYTCLVIRNTLSLIPLSESIYEDIRGSDGSIYAADSAHVSGRSFALCGVWPYVLRVVGAVRTSLSRTPVFVHSSGFFMAVADPFAHVPADISSWLHWRGADAPSLLAAVYAATRNHDCCNSRGRPLTDGVVLHGVFLFEADPLDLKEYCLG